jgi:hypothetical protein
MNDDLCNLLISKGELKIDVFNAASETMQFFKDAAKEFDDNYKTNYSEAHETVPVLYNNKNQNLFQIKFAGDILVFMMHSNIFEFPRDHEVMKSTYIKEDKERSYCGMISIYNFLSDSFKYDRINDTGYMIGRVLVNKEHHFYVEGKRELAQILNNFNTNKFNIDTAREILHSAIKYTINFDLLLPDFDMTKIISVNDMMQLENQIMTIPTAKRLGFSFERDIDDKKK